MATPVGILTAASAHLAAALPGLGTCAIYAGEFAAGEIRRAAVKSPAVLVACLSAQRKGLVETGEYDFTCRFTAYCMTRHAGGREQRAVTALETALAVMAAIEGARFGLSGLHPARVSRLDNLYAAEIDTASVALWAVTWDQVCRMGPRIADDGSLPVELYASWAPEIGIPHQDDYELVPGLPEEGAI